jgi:hypothetical protein
VQIPNIGETVLVCRNGKWERDWLAQVRIGNEKCVIVWGGGASISQTFDQLNPWHVKAERFKRGEHEWREIENVESRSGE